MAIEDIAGVSNVTISTTGALTVYNLSGLSAIAVSTTASLNVARKIAGSSAIVIRAGGVTGASLSGVAVSSIQCWQPYDIVIDRYLYGGLNNFASEAAPTRAVALYRCESGGLLNETLQNNHLSQSANPVIQPSPSVGTPREGVSSVIWNKVQISNGPADDSGYSWERPDASLTSNFPGQSGNVSEAYAFCGWMYLNWSSWTADPGNDDIQGWFHKSTNYGCLWTDASNPGSLYVLWLGIGSGSIGLGGVARVVNGRWYHVGVSAENVAGTVTWIIRVWDNTALAMHWSGTGSQAGSFNHNSTRLHMTAQIIGGFPYTWRHQDAWDECVWFNRALSAAEIDLIRTGNYYF